jgi:hypothetical protein
VKFELTREWLEERVRAGRCEVTGLPFELATYSRGTRFSPWAPSIDRLDPTGHYAPENCQVVIWMYNLCKNKWADADVLRMAEALVSKQKGK